MAHRLPPDGQASASLRPCSSTTGLDVALLGLRVQLVVRGPFGFAVRTLPAWVGDGRMPAATAAREPSPGRGRRARLIAMTSTRLGQPGSARELRHLDPELALKPYPLCPAGSWLIVRREPWRAISLELRGTELACMPGEFEPWAKAVALLPSRRRRDAWHGRMPTRCWARSAGGGCQQRGQVVHVLEHDGVRSLQP